MVAAVGASTAYSSATANAATAGGSRLGLEAKVDTLKKQLADWVTCPSAKTPQGKAKIQDITSKLDTAQAQIKKLDKILPSPTSNTAQAQTPDAGQNARVDASNLEPKKVDPATKTSSTGAGPGSLVDVFV
jgi:hypothetical protein